MARSSGGKTNKGQGNQRSSDDIAIQVRVPAGQSEVMAVLKATNKDDPSEEDQRALATLFAKYPEMAQLVGNLAQGLRERKLRMFTPNHLTRKSIEVTLETMQRDLGYDDAPMASKLLIEQVLTCWLDLADVQWKYDTRLADSHTLTLGAYWDRRLTAAQGRYLKALETLARVNRLFRVVPVQVNIAAQGGQQINVAGNAPQSR